MKIAQIAPLIECVPPKAYGGTERIVSILTEELVNRGHSVTLFASGDSTTDAQLYPTYPRSLRAAMPDDVQGRVLASLLHLGKAYEMAQYFDVIHDHTGHFGVAFANSCNKPVVMTMHGAFNEQNIKMYTALTNPHLVTISHNQRLSAPGLNHLATVYNGVSLERFPFSEKHDGYLLYVGRICPEKGTHLAIEVAQKLKMKLIIAAKLDYEKFGDYFEQKVRPHLSDEITWIGEVSEPQRNELYANAYCFLHPVTWPEPFGLTLVEAMACGCPVVAFEQGSIPEVISHEETGYVVHTVDEMVEAVQRISNIDRKKCREHAITNFNEQRMVNNYESLYRALVEQTLHTHTQWLSTNNRWRTMT